MDKKAVLLTREGRDNLLREKEQLINVERDKVTKEIAIARSLGDLTENADYAAAREKQAEIESRIREIEAMLPYIVIIDEETEEGEKDIVKTGSKVVILDLSEEDAEEETYQIVGTTETNPLKGRISNDCPLAKAMIGRKIGETVTVGVAVPYDVKIVDIL